MKTIFTAIKSSLKKPAIKELERKSDPTGNPFVLKRIDLLERELIKSAEALYKIIEWGGIGLVNCCAVNIITANLSICRAYGWVFVLPVMNLRFLSGKTGVYNNTIMYRILKYCKIQTQLISNFFQQ